MDIPEIVEEIIELLLSGLRDTVCLQGEILIFYHSSYHILMYFKFPSIETLIEFIPVYSFSVLCFHFQEPI